MTSAGVPLGSAPTEMAVAREASGTSRKESLPGSPSERPELVASDEYEAGADSATGKLGERPVRRIRLVGEADLHMLCVTGDPRIRDARTFAPLQPQCRPRRQDRLLRPPGDDPARP